MVGGNLSRVVVVLIAADVLAEGLALLAAERAAERGRAPRGGAERGRRSRWRGVPCAGGWQRDLLQDGDVESWSEYGPVWGEVDEGSFFVDADGGFHWGMGLYPTTTATQSSRKNGGSAA